MLKGKFLLMAVLASCAGCNDSSVLAQPITTELKASAMTTEVSIKLGEMGPSFAKRYPNKVRVVHQPAGLDFYKINWERPRGTVRVEHDKHSFVIDDVLGISSSQDLEEFKSEGLNEFDVNSGMSVPSPSLIPHDEARLKTYAILRRIMDAGWKNTVDVGDPRIRGKDRLLYAISKNQYTGLDATYLPTPEEWMQIESRTPWNFYADGVYLQVIFTRERTLTDPTKPGSYLLTFNIKTETEYFRSFAGPDNRLRWKEVVPQEIAKAKAERPKREAELRAKGFKIDESYQDPPVPVF